MPTFPPSVNIHKARPLAKFTVIPNELAQRESLSIHALGLLTYLLSLPDSWEIRMDMLQKRTGLSTRPLRRILNELAKADHMHRFVIPGPTPDTFAGSRWHVFAHPDDLRQTLAITSNPKGFIGDRAFLRQSVKRPDVQKETLEPTKTQPTASRPLPPPDELAAFLRHHNISKRMAKVFFDLHADYASSSTPPTPRDWPIALLSFANKAVSAA